MGALAFYVSPKGIERPETGRRIVRAEQHISDLRRAQVTTAADVSGKADAADVARIELALGTYDSGDLTLQEAIDAAYDAGGGVVKMPPGVHTLTEQLRLKSGVTLDLTSGATIRRGFNTSGLGAGLIGCEAGENMAVIGGVLDGNGQNFDTSFDLLYAESVRGLSLIGVTFLSVVDFHAVDLADCETVRIRDCTFAGFWNKSTTRQFSEAIQLDPGISAGGTINRDVLVTGCTFTGPLDTGLTDFDPWPCALGNHSGYDGLYHEDVRFQANRVYGATWAGMNLLNMTGVTVDGNLFEDCEHGVRLRLKDDVTPAQACSGVAITDNRFKGIVQASVKFASPTPANVGNIDTGRHTGVTIAGNSSEAEYALVQVAWASRVTIDGNEHTGGNYGIDVRFSDGVTITGNTIEDVEQTGIWINESTETSEAGLGLTADITIGVNTLRRCGYRGVHVNCAAVRVAIGAVQVIDPSLADPSREGIRGDSGPIDLSIIGAVVRSTSSPAHPYGISVSGSPTRVTIKGCESSGSTARYEVQTVDALLDIEDDGSPEGVYSAAIGSRFARLDGTAGSILYLKTSGTGNTGWTAIA